MRIETSSSSEQYNVHAQANNIVKDNRKENSMSHHKNIDSDVHVQEESRKVGEHEVIQAIEKANKHFKTYDRRLEFSIHDQTKQIMVKVINTEDDTIVREIPSEKILDMMAKLWEMAGIFVDEKR